MKRSYPMLICAAVSALTLTSCFVAVDAPLVAGPGYYTSVPSGYYGDTYFYGGRYYYGGRYEPGRYLYRGRYYNHRYFHNGHYFYGGRYDHHDHGGRPGGPGPVHRGGHGPVYRGGHRH